MEEILIVPFQRASITDAEKDAVLNVLNSGWLTTGVVSHNFEEAFTQFLLNTKDNPLIKTNNKINDSESSDLSLVNTHSNLETQKNKLYSLAVNSNTSGMLLAMEACGVNESNYIITTCYTFNSTPMAARHLKSNVIFCDVAPGSYNIDCSMLESLLIKCNSCGKKVAAVIPVHIAGVVCDMVRIKALSKKFGFYIIEDCAHSFPSLTKLGYAGTLGDIGVFSFYATKTITTGEGGMVVTHDEKLFKRMSIMRLHGMSRDAWDRYTNPTASWQYDIVAPGYKCNLPDILAAIGVVQLSRANDLRDKRRKIFDKYINAFSNSPYFFTPPDDDTNSCHLFLLRVNENTLQISRNDFAKLLQENGVSISVHFIPCANFTYWRDLYKIAPGDFPNAQNMFKATISLPLFPDMSDEQVDYVIKTVLNIAKDHSACKLN